MALLLVDITQDNNRFWRRAMQIYFKSENCKNDPTFANFTEIALIAATLDPSPTKVDNCPNRSKRRPCYDKSKKH